MAPYRGHHQHSAGHDIIANWGTTIGYRQNFREAAQHACAAAPKTRTGQRRLRSPSDEGFSGRLPEQQ
jgi:hypothetical protein